MTAPAIRTLPRSFSSSSFLASRTSARTRRKALLAGSHLAGLAILVGFAAVPVAAQTASLASPSQIPLGSGFNHPGGLALDSHGNIFVADTGNSAVKEILAAGGYTTVNNLASGSFKNPQSLTLDAYGNVWVADTGNGAVKVISALSGYTTVSTVESSSLDGTPPTGVAIDKDGNLWVTGPYSSTLVGFFEFLALSGYVTNPIALATNSTDPTPALHWTKAKMFLSELHPRCSKFRRAITLEPTCWQLVKWLMRRVWR